MGAGASINTSTRRTQLILLQMRAHVHREYKLQKRRLVSAAARPGRLLTGESARRRARGGNGGSTGHGGNDSTRALSPPRKALDVDKRLKALKPGALAAHCMEQFEEGLETTPRKGSPYRFYCPICMCHFRAIFEAACCGNYVCRGCALGFVETQDAVRASAVARAAASLDDAALAAALAVELNGSDGAAAANGSNGARGSGRGDGGAAAAAASAASAAAVEATAAAAAETCALGVRCPHCNVLGFEPRAVAMSAEARSYDDDERAQAAAAARCCADASKPRTSGGATCTRDGAPAAHFEDAGSLDALRCKLLNFEVGGGGDGDGRSSPNPADDDDDDHATFASGVVGDELDLLNDGADNASTADGASARSSGDGSAFGDDDDDGPDPNGETLPTPTSTPTASSEAGDSSFSRECHRRRGGADARRGAPPERPTRRRDGCRRTTDGATPDDDDDATGSFLFVEHGTSRPAAASPSTRRDDAPFAESFVRGVLVRGGSPCLRDAPRALAAH